MRGESLSGPTPRRIGIRDVARRAGVAISTVSKVFSGKGEVMPAMRDRVLAAASELGYQPNYVAQSLRRGATKLIGFVTSDLSDPFSSEIVAGAESLLRPAGYALVVMSSRHDPVTDAANVRSLNSRRVDSILVAPSREDDAELLNALAEFDGPIVAIESELRTQLPLDVVCADHRRGMADAIGYLHALGHSAISVLIGALARRSGRERLAGLENGSQRHRLGDQVMPIFTGHEAEVAEAEIGRALDGPTPPTAIVACSLPLLVGALRALDSRRLAVGQDVALVGWDDSLLAELYHPPIAVVDRNLRAIGAAAARLAMRRLGHGQPGDDSIASTEILPTRFIPRASCMQAPMPRREAMTKRT